MNQAYILTRPELEPVVKRFRTRTLRCARFAAGEVASFPRRRRASRFDQTYCALEEAVSWARRAGVVLMRVPVNTLMEARLVGQHYVGVLRSQP